MPDPTLKGNGEDCPSCELRRTEDPWQTGDHPCNTCGGSGRIAYLTEKICHDTAKAYWSQFMTQVEPKNLSITEMAAQFGVTKRLLRFYEENGFLKPLRFGTRRVYRPEDQEDMRVIQAATGLGLMLKEIGAVFKPGARSIAVSAEMLTARAAALETDSVEKAKIAGLIRHRLAMQSGDTVLIGGAK